MYMVSKYNSMAFILTKFIMQYIFSFKTLTNIRSFAWMAEAYTYAGKKIKSAPKIKL